MATTRLLVNIEANSAKLVEELRKSRQGIESVKSSAEAMKSALSTIKVTALVELGQKAIQVTQQIYQFAESGAKVKAVEGAFESMATASGVAIDSLIADLKEATNSTVDNSDLMIKATKLMAEGFLPEQIVAVGEAARVSARLTGEDVKTAYVGVADSIVNLRERGLKTQGFVIDLNDAYEKHAKLLGVSREQLKTYGQQTAALNAVIEKAKELQDKLNISQETAYEKMQKQRSLWKEFGENIAKAASEAWGLAGALAQIALSKVPKLGPEAWMGLLPAHLEEARYIGRIPTVPTTAITPSQIKPGFSEEAARTILEERNQYEKEYWETQHKLWDIEDNLRKVEGERAQQLADEMFPSQEKVNLMTEMGNKYYEEQRIELLSIQALVKGFGWEDYAAGIEAAGVAIQQLNQTMIANQKAVTQMQEEQNRINQMGQEFASTLTSNMVMLMTSTDKWGEKFKKVGESILQTIMQIIAKQLVMNALFEKNEKGEYGSFLGGGSGIGSIVKGIGGLLGLQGGGIATQPTLALIAERRPEAVVPLDEYEGKGRGTNVTYITYIQATDVESFERRYGETIMKAIGESEKSGGTFRNILKRF
jgi:hypothetical protein